MVATTHRNENVEEVLQGGQLGYQLLDDFTERLKDGMVIDARQVETETVS